MPIVRNARYRAKILFLITVEHCGLISAVPVPEGYGPDEAARMLQQRVEQDKALVHGTPIIDRGKPIYRLWQLNGSAHKEDMEAL